jgi:hypothetical protein
MIPPPAVHLRHAPVADVTVMFCSILACFLLSPSDSAYPRLPSLSGWPAPASCLAITILSPSDSWPRSSASASHLRFRPGADCCCICFYRWDILVPSLAAVLPCALIIMPFGPGLRLFQKCFVLLHVIAGQPFLGSPVNHFLALTCFHVLAFSCICSSSICMQYN